MFCIRAFIVKYVCKWPIHTDIDSMICNYADDNALVNERKCFDT